MAPSQAISFNGQTIHIAEEMNLTEMFKASGVTRNHRPTQWIHYKGASFIQSQKESVGSANTLCAR